MNKSITFTQWLKSESGRIYLLVSSVFTVGFSVFQGLKLFGIESIPLPKLPATDQAWLTVNYGIQVAFISYVVFFTAYRFCRIRGAEVADLSEKAVWHDLELSDPSRPPQSPSGEDAWIEFKMGANNVVKQFTWFWLLAWFSWLLHYAFLLAESMGWLAANSAARNLVNNLNSLMFVFLFMTLTVSTSKYGALFWSKLVFSILVLFGVELVTYGVSGDSKAAALTFTAISGLFASVALAAFVGSIDSKFMNIPVWIIPALYLYAAIQSFYVFFQFGQAFLIAEPIASNMPVPVNDTQAFVNKTQIMVTIGAFVLKALLFITVTWLLRSGRLVYFVIEESSLNFRKDKNFRDFLEIIKTEEARLT